MSDNLISVKALLKESLLSLKPTQFCKQALLQKPLSTF